MANFKDIPVNKGKVVKIKGDSAAVFNNMGIFQVFSATCPHLGCEIAWNDSENTWDCPCHGSKFYGNGKLKNGPAKRDLDKMETD